MKRLTATLAELPPAPRLLDKRPLLTPEQMRDVERRMRRVLQHAVIWNGRVPADADD